MRQYHARGHDSRQLHLVLLNDDFNKTTAKISCRNFLNGLAYISSLSRMPKGMLKPVSPIQLGRRNGTSLKPRQFLFCVTLDDPQTSMVRFDLSTRPKDLVSTTLTCILIDRCTLPQTCALPEITAFPLV